MSTVTQLNCNMSGSEEVPVNNGSIVSTEELLDQIHAHDNLVAFQTIYIKLHDIAGGILDSQQNPEKSAKAVLELMEYILDYTENL